MQILKIKRSTIQWHIVAWMIFILYEVSVSLVLGANKGFWGYFPYYLFHIILFYVYAHLCLDFVFGKKRRLSYLLPMTILLLACYLFLILGAKMAVAYYHLTNDKMVIDTSTLVGSLWRAIYFLLLSSSYWTVRYSISRNNRISQLELQQITAEKNRYKLENAYLLVQMNPHLLFNSLNFIYNSVRKVSPETGKSVMILADIMRYSLSEPNEDGLIKLEDEIDHLYKLIEISRLRFENNFQLNFFYVGDAANIKIIPLILVTLVENLLKHGDLTKKEFPGMISLQVDPNKIVMTTQNYIKKTELKYSTKIGIKNLRLRLQSHYKENNFQLDLWEAENIYHVKLLINL
jgi:two-component system LytT family sensor kinase